MWDWLPLRRIAELDPSGVASGVALRSVACIMRDELAYSECLWLPIPVIQRQKLTFLHKSRLHFKWKRSWSMCMAGQCLSVFLHRACRRLTIHMTREASETVVVTSCFPLPTRLELQVELLGQTFCSIVAPFPSFEWDGTGNARIGFEGRIAVSMYSHVGACLLGVQRRYNTSVPRGC